MSTSFPVSELLSQRRALASTAAQLRRVNASDSLLSAEARRLSDPATVGEIAHQEFGLVHSGVKAYDVLPPSGSAPGSGTGAAPLTGPPVAPGGLPSGSAGLPAPSGGGPSAGSSNGRPKTRSPASGFWQRVLHSLEFWR
ncbi:MAG: hypothetical protein M0035_15390 [Actinomycetota bacterium]|nr:hypothetical protein [Actinomycetota bacterium]